jgi:hypothetical protein
MGCGNSRMNEVSEADKHIWRGTVKLEVKSANIKKDFEFISNP